jgi:hypothetical protein
MFLQANLTGHLADVTSSRRQTERYRGEIGGIFSLADGTGRWRQLKHIIKTVGTTRVCFDRFPLGWHWRADGGSMR